MKHLDGVAKSVTCSHIKDTNHARRSMMCVCSDDEDANAIQMQHEVTEAEDQQNMKRWCDRQTNSKRETPIREA